MDLTARQNERLRQEENLYRRRTGATKAEVARAIGVEPPSLSRWRNRHGGASYATAMALAKLFGKSLDEVIGSPGPPDIFISAARGDEGEAGALVIEAKTPPAETTSTPSRATAGGSEHPASRMMAIALLLKLRRLQGLEAWIEDNPTARLSVDGLVRAMAAYDELPADARGNGSVSWWSSFLKPFLSPGDGRPAEQDTGSRRRYEGR